MYSKISWIRLIKLSCFHESKKIGLDKRDRKGLLASDNECLLISFCFSAIIWYQFMQEGALFRVGRHHHLYSFWQNINKGQKRPPQRSEEIFNVLSSLMHFSVLLCHPRVKCHSSTMRSLWPLKSAQEQ